MILFRVDPGLGLATNPLAGLLHTSCRDSARGSPLSGLTPTEKFGEAAGGNMSKRESRQHQEEAHIYFAAHDGTVAVWPNPNGPLGDLYDEVTVEVRGVVFRRPVVWIFRFAIPFGDKFDRIHGTREDWEALKRLMRHEGIKYEEKQAYVPCCRSYEWYPPTGSDAEGQQGWCRSDAAQLCIRGPLMIFRS